MDYTNILRENNLKVTPQRLVIVESLYVKGHMSIDDLYKTLYKSFPTISLATIYKNINAMLSKFFIQEVKIPNKKSVYELTKDEHSHIVCSKCNNIMDISLDTSSIVNSAQNITNYKIDTSAIIFNGICPNCSDK